MGELWPCADVRCRDREQAQQERIEQLEAERDRLLKEVRKLDALEAMGVDNWEWYSDAMQYMNEKP